MSGAGWTSRIGASADGWEPWFLSKSGPALPDLGWRWGRKNIDFKTFSLSLTQSAKLPPYPLLPLSKKKKKVFVIRLVIKRLRGKLCGSSKSSEDPLIILD